MKIAIGNDRNGIDYKKRLTEHMETLGHIVVNCGTDENFPADYPVHAERVGRLVATGECDRGVVICATGIGVCLVVGKIKGIRSGMGYADDVARLMRQHNDANVIGFGQDYMSYEEVERRLDIFLTTEFLGGYHNLRLQQITDLEEGRIIHQMPIMNKDNAHTKGK